MKHIDVEVLHPGAVQVRPAEDNPAPSTPQGAGSDESLETERKRFAGWLSREPRTHTEERLRTRARRLIKERQEAAEAARAQQLEAVRARASAFVARREDAAARVAAKTEASIEALKTRLYTSLEAAEVRRQALLEAEKERLRAGHELVLTRLTMSKTAEEAQEEARLRLEQRLAAAEEERAQRLASRASRAGSKVARAKEVSALTRQLKAQESEARLAGLLTRLEEAERRRNARLQAQGSTLTSPRSNGALTSPGSLPRARPQSVPHTTASFPATPDVAHAQDQQIEGSGSSGSGPGSSPSASPMPATPDRAAAEDIEDSAKESPQQQSPHAESKPSAVPDDAQHPMGHISTAKGIQHQGNLRIRAHEGSAMPVNKHHPLGAIAARLGSGSAPGSPSVAARVEAMRRQSSTRKVQQAWRTFMNKKRTTASLAQAFVDCGLTRLPVTPAAPAAPGQPTTGAAASQASSTARAPAPAVVIGLGTTPTGLNRVDGGFEAFAEAMQAPKTVSAATALLKRLESRLVASEKQSSSNPSSPAGGAQGTAAAHGSGASNLGPGRNGPAGVGRRQHGGSHGGAGGAMCGSERSVAATLKRLFPAAKQQLPRYPARVFLAALMILRHPKVIFNSQGEREDALAQAASKMISAFEALLERVLAPPPFPAKGTAQAPGTAAQPATAFATAADADLAAEATGSEGPGATPASGLPLLASTGSRKLSQSLSIEIPTTPTRQGAAPPDASSGYPNLGSPVAMGIASWRAANRANSHGGRGLPGMGGHHDSTAVQTSSQPAQGDSRTGNDSGAAQASSPGSSSQGAYFTIGQRLVEFDRSWAQYLDQFAAWKLQDASQLEDELIRMAVEMEKSMARKIKRSQAAAASLLSSSPSMPRSARNLEAVAVQVAHDHELLRERILRLAGPQGITRLEAALEAAREAVEQESDLGTASELESASASEVEGPSRSSSFRATPQRPFPPTPTKTTPSPGPGPSIPASPPADHLAATSPGASPQAGSGSAAAAAAAAAPAAAEAVTTPPRPALAPGLKKGFFGSRPAAPAAKASPGVASPSASQGTGSVSPSRSGQQEGEGSPAARQVRRPLEVSVTDLRAPSAPRSPGSAVSSTPLSPEAAAPAAPGVPADAISNLQLVWELVHNPSYSLPASDALAALERVALPPGASALPVLDQAELESMGVEAAVAAMRSHAQAVEEQAFYDSLAARMAATLRDGSVGTFVAPLLSELGRELAGVMSDPTAADALDREFAPRALLDRLAAATRAGANAGTGAGMAAALGLTQALQRLAALVVSSVAPAREDETKAAHTALEAELSAALQAAAPVLATQQSAAQGLEAGGATASEVVRQVEQSPVGRLAWGLARAVRTLQAQLRLLKLDAANARLHALGAQMGGGRAVTWIRTKFALLHNISMTDAGLSGTTAEASQQPGDAAPAAGAGHAHRVAIALPRTTAWLSRTARGADAVRSYLTTSGGLDPEDQQVLASASTAGAAAAAQASTGIPAMLRAGLRAPIASTSSPATASSPGAAGTAAASGTTAGSSTTPLDPSIRPVLPVPLSSWRGMVRTGIIALISSETAAVGPALAETLAWDARRLHEAQQMFQQLVVTTASMLLVGRMRAQKGRPPLTPAEADAGRRRLRVVLASPTLTLPDLTAELTHMVRQGAAAASGASGEATDVPTQPSQPANAGTSGSDEAEEGAALQSAIRTLMDPGSGAFRSVSNALAGALSLHMLLGPAAVSGDAGMGRAVGALLGRVGAGPLAPDVAALAERLLAITAVSEAVHGLLYQAVYQVAQPQSEGQP